ncbi:MAG: serine hydrolase [Gemmatimonadaceae bacterium]
MSAPRPHFRYPAVLPATLCALLTVAVARAPGQSPASGRASGGLRVDTARVDSVFASFDRRDSPGCALGIIRGGRLDYARGYGMSDLERGTPITPRTIFDIGSTSKQFTAATGRAATVPSISRRPSPADAR